MSEKKKKKKKREKQLPNKLLLIKSCDKQFHERNYEGRNLLNYCHPWVMVCTGRRNAGKSMYVKNTIIRANPPFERIQVMSCDPMAKEWANDIEADILTEIPSPDEYFDNEEKTLLVLDDICFVDLDKESKKKLDRLVGFISSHCNVSIAICNQDYFSVIPIARKCASLHVIWRPTCSDELNTVSRRTGVPAKQIIDIFDNQMPEPTDCLTINLIKGATHRLVKNGFEPIS
jgi:hypothetical protein